MTSLRPALLLPLLLLSAGVWAACDAGGPVASIDIAAPDTTSADTAAGEAPGPIALDPAPPVVQRLTARQYARCVHDVLGEHIVVPPGLDADVEHAGFLAIGASLATVSRLGVERYEAAAFAIAEQALDDEHREALVACSPAGVRDDVCAEDVIADLGRRLWRAPLGPEDLAALVAIAGQGAEALDDFHGGLTFALAGLLQSPRFLFRIEVGEADDAVPDGRRRTGFELATRLSFLVWNTTPDDALLDAAEAGELDTPEGLEAHLDRLLASPRASEGIRQFFEEYFELHRLDELSKDTSLFVHMGPQLGPSAREETLRGAEHLVMVLDGDYRELLTTRRTFLDRTLAAVYDVPAPDRDGFAETTLAADSPRRGLLGQVSFLALQSHPTTSSATLRGQFVRERLLCGSVPIPPVNANTGLPEPSEDAVTLRERSEIHLLDPACAGCHLLMDPIGLGLENFDGVGRFRTLDNGGLIDPSGDLDGVPFADASELAEVVASHPDLASCFARNVYRYATGHVEELGERDLVKALGEGFAADGWRVLPLWREVVLSPGFRRLALPSEELPEAISEGAR